MNCAEYWESQGVDALDAALSVGCPNVTGNDGHDVIGGLLFFALLVVGAAIARKQGQL